MSRQLEAILIGAPFSESAASASTACGSSPITEVCSRVDGEQIYDRTQGYDLVGILEDFEARR